MAREVSEELEAAANPVGQEVWAEKAERGAAEPVERGDPAAPCDGSIVTSYLIG
jgi:hypothetical protein